MQASLQGQPWVCASRHQYILALLHLPRALRVSTALHLIVETSMLHDFEADAVVHSLRGLSYILSYLQYTLSATGITGSNVYVPQDHTPKAEMHCTLHSKQEACSASFNCHLITSQLHTLCFSLRECSSMIAGSCRNFVLGHDVKTIN